MDVRRRGGVAVLEDAACAIGSEILWNDESAKDRKAAGRGRRRGLLLVPPAQGGESARATAGRLITTRHADWDKQFRLLGQHAMSVPERGSPPGCKAGFASLGSVRPLATTTKSLRHCRRRWARTAQAPACDPPAAAAPGRTLRRTAGRHSRSGSTPRADVGAQQLAELLRRSLPERLDQRGVMQAHARQRRQHAPGHHVQPSGARLRRRIALHAAAHVRTRTAAHRAVTSLSRNDSR